MGDTMWSQGEWDQHWMPGRLWLLHGVSALGLMSRRLGWVTTLRPAAPWSHQMAFQSGCFVASSYHSEAAVMPRLCSGATDRACRAADTYMSSDKYILPTRRK